MNRSPSAALDFKTPQEAQSGKPPDLNNFIIFCCTAYAHVSQSKLEPRAIKGYFIRYPEDTKGYKIWCIDGKPSRTLISMNVVFDEDSMVHQKVETELTTTSIDDSNKSNFKMESGRNQNNKKNSSKVK